MRFNKLSLNYSKPFYMLIGPRGKRLHYFTVQIKDNTTSQTNSTKYLGVYNDDKLTWSCSGHVSATNPRGQSQWKVPKDQTENIKCLDQK